MEWWCWEVGDGGWSVREWQCSSIAVLVRVEAGCDWSGELEGADGAEEPRQAAQLGMN